MVEMCSKIFSTRDDPMGRTANLTREQMFEDLMAITQEEEQWHKLYHCLEEVPLREPSVSQIEELFTGTKGLDSASDKMLVMAEALEKTTKKIADLVEVLNVKRAEVSSKVDVK